MSRPWIAKGKPFRGILAPKEDAENNKSKTVETAAPQKKYPVYCGEMAMTNGFIVMEMQMLELARLRAERIALDLQIAEDQMDLDSYNSLANGNGGVPPKSRR